MPNLCQLTTVKSRLGIASHDVDDDALLNGFIALVGSRFERECRRQFGRTAGATQEFDGDVTELLLDRYPVESVSAFALKDNETDGFVAQSGVDYILRAASNGVKCLVTLESPLGSMRQRLQVTYTGGYVLPGTTPGAGQSALPDDLERAAVEQVVHFYRLRDKLGLVNASGEGAAINIQTEELLPVVRNTLKLYERWGNL